MPEDLALRAALAGLGVALAAGPLGCFVVWRRMAYLGDATAHAAILGVALALASALPVMAAVLGVALAMALAVSRLSGGLYAEDTLLGVLSHGALAAGLVALSLAGAGSVEGYLFGEILLVGDAGLAVIWGAAAAVALLLALRWRALVTATVDPDLAVASGLAPGRDRLVLVMALALLVAAALKVVGALLITALLIVPAAAARPLARTPEAMAAIATIFAVAAVLGGLWGAWRADTPAGPSIVAAAALIFAIVQLARPLLPGRR